MVVKKLISWQACKLASLIAFLFLSACACASPYIRHLQIDIDQAPYSIDEYRPGEFDCSNEANLLDNYLEGKGYDSKIMVNGRHAYVLVDNGTVVDPVTKRILKGKTPQDYPGAVIFKDPEMLQAYFEPTQWEKEWSYERRGTLPRVHLAKEIGKGIIMAGAICLIAYFIGNALAET